MCGIVAVASKDGGIFDDLFLGLKRLEYRGYDSSGVAFLEGNGEISCIKIKGRVSDLEKIAQKNPDVSIGIGHTRWATHGVPSDINAHPHTSSEVAIVHNGIIENYEELRRELHGKGYGFKSQTDSEVAMVLIHDLIHSGFSKKEAMLECLKCLRGSFAIVAIFKGESDVYGIKQGCPMVIGYGKGRNFIASDVYAIAGIAQDVSYLTDGEMAIASAENVRVFRSDGQEVSKDKSAIKIAPNDVDKGTYETYMFKEINEQAGCIRNNVKHHYNFETGEIKFAGLPASLAGFNNIKIVACGTSYNAGFIAKYWLEKFAGVEVAVEVASEFRYRPHNFGLEHTLYIFISQSGETADTMTALKYAKERICASSKIVALVNVAESSIAKMADYVIECFSGPEIGVAATKSFTSQLTSLMFLTLKLALDKNLMKLEGVKKFCSEQFLLVPNKIEEFLSNDQIIENIETFCAMLANQIQNGFKLIYVGKDVFYGVCMEAALKTQELFYIPILAFTSGELKHGPIAILDDKTLVICLAHSELLYSKTSSSIEEIVTREAKVAAVCDVKHEKTSFFIDTSIFGAFNDFTAPIFYAIPMHLISYKISLLLGNDVDKPRGLAKSVTVE